MSCSYPETLYSNIVDGVSLAFNVVNAAKGTDAAIVEEFIGVKDFIPLY
ncbi:hypothetical protein [Solibacillus sp. FSL K6-1523]